MKRWANVNALYQIYPRSFYDTNADGVGDLRGIIEKLDYLKGREDSLGVDAIWLSPFYPSPMADFGYDVSDYRDVHPLFGTLDDFDQLLRGAHERHIKVMIDLVPNHTSDQHPWFQSARRSRTDDKRDYYVWRDPKPDGSPPNNWLSNFGGSAWQFDEQTGQYYLHSFLKEQPDLNWDSPTVREEMADVLRFWCDRGVDGFRVDVARNISKDPEFRDDPPNPAYAQQTPGEDPFYSLLHTHSRYGPHLFEYWREMAQVVEKYPDVIMLFEDYPDEAMNIDEQYERFYDIAPGVIAPFNFDGIVSAWSAESFGGLVRNFQDLLDNDDRPAYCFGNHDQPRIASRFGVEQARLIAMFQLALPGLPVMYYGDELGMTNGFIPSDKIQDPFEKANPGIGLGRDPSRTPMQWTSDENAGFSQSDPWLPIAEGGDTVEQAREDDDSFLALYQRLLQLRHDYPQLISGGYKQKHIQDDLLVFERYDDAQRLVVLLNFSADTIGIAVPAGSEVLCSTHPGYPPRLEANGISKLGPFQGIIVRPMV